MTNYHDIPKVGVDDFARADFVTWYQGELKRISVANQLIYSNAVARGDTIYQTAIKQFEQMLTLAVAIYGDKHAVVKYLKAHKPRQRAGVSAPPNFTRRVRAVWHKYEAWFEDEQRREYERDYRKRRAEMNALLQELGYVPGEHYSPTRAITFAAQVINPVQQEVRMLPVGDEP